jgi:hypothetical protein
MTTILRFLTVCGALALPAVAQEPERIEFHVTSVSGRSVYFDQGSAAGLGVGDEVELFPPGVSPFRVTLRSVARSSSRAEIPLDRPLPDIGTRGVAAVTPPADRPEATEPKRARNHPGWTAPLTTQDQDAPLLAPAFGGGAASRPTTLNGRIFGQLEYDRSDGGGGADSWILARVGTRLDVTNPLGYGGRFTFAGELTHRGTDLFEFGNDTDDRGRLDRASYAWGDDEAEDWRFEVGRFVSPYTSELGVIDGAEVLRRLGGGFAVGAGFGALPLPFPPLSWDGDIGAHAFVNWRARTTRYLAATLGFQKTWHEGAADRDLMFGRFNWDIADPARLAASFKVDFYTGKDDLKDKSAELTEGWVDLGTKPLSTIDLGVTASRFRWAQMLRAEYAFLPTDLVQDGVVHRVGARLGWRFVENWKIGGRVDAWDDQDRSGTSGELRLDGWGLLGGLSDLSVAVFTADGSFVSGPGFRVRVDRAFGDARIAVRYEMLRWESDSLISGPVTFTSQRAGLDLDWLLGASWSIQAHGDLVFGDGEDGYQLGAFVQYRF